MQCSDQAPWPDKKALYMIPKIVLTRRFWICKNCTFANLASLECHCSGTLVEVVPRDSENIQNSNPVRLKYPASPPPLFHFWQIFSAGIIFPSTVSKAALCSDLDEGKFSA